MIPVFLGLDNLTTIRWKGQQVGEFIPTSLEALWNLIVERDKRYNERFEAERMVTTLAFAAQEKLTIANATAGKEALTKSEQAQGRYNEITNQLRETLLPRKEFEIAIRQLEIDIAGLRESRSELSGEGKRGAIAVTHAQWVVAIIIAIAGLLISIIRH